MQAPANIGWEKVKVVIFDVDGTLYKQSKLRKKMFYALLAYYARRPWRWREILLLHHFRAEREKRSATVYTDLENAQYAWCAEKGKYPVPKIMEVVDYWMFQFPVRYLSTCTFPGIRSLFGTLRKNNLKIAIYSDYKAHGKLKAMELQADLVVSSTDPEVDRLKPDPKGLLYIAQKLNVTPAECLFIGDRPELDGECARRANMPYLIMADKKPFKTFDFYKNLEDGLRARTTAKYNA